MSQSNMGQSVSRWRIIHYPAEPGRIVSLSERWAADNYYETAVFGSREEAEDFALGRWGPQYSQPTSRGQS